MSGGGSHGEQHDALPAIPTELETAGFEQVREIGRGGFGVVYRCVQPSLNRTVAVKVLTGELDDENTARFLREQRAMGSLTGHPHIVSVLETGTSVGGRPYIVMPFHSPDSLETRLRQSGPLSFSEAVRMGVKIAGALETAHRLHILHRDIKPSNLLFTDYGEPALADFGIAHIAGGFETTAGIITGTPAYTAPEVLQGEPPTTASDIYSLGATLFSAVTGHAAFERRSGEKLIAQFVRITRDAIPDLREEGIPDDLCALVEQAMSTNPRERPTSAAAFGNALRQVQAHHGWPVESMALLRRREGSAPQSLPGHSEDPPDDSTSHLSSTNPPSTPAATGSVPLQLSTFIGRRIELTETKRLLTTSRLVTLMGVGGVGKTRLALRTADDMKSKFSGRVWFVDLGDLQQGPLLADVVAATLGLRGERARPALDILSDFLAPHDGLLVLDNCEQVVQATAALAERLLQSCPRLHILVTSREILGVGGEAVVRVPPLSVPAPDREHPLAGLSQYDAVTLFADRAAAAVPTFAINDANREAVIRICHRLDGLPLAIELAAARLRAMSAEQIVHRLTDRFKLLTLGTRTAPTRQQTLQWCVDWSYDLCAGEEQQVWTQLAVFAGTFELDAAEQILTTSDLSLSDILTALIDKSILLREEHGSVVRFRMLETLRDYGRVKLRNSGDEANVRQRHRDWYLQLALDARDQWIGPDQLGWIARLSREQPNLREAMEVCLSTTDEDGARAGLRLATALYPFWLARGLYSEGRRWIDQTLAHAPDMPTPSVAQAIYASSSLAALQGDLPAVTALLTSGQGLTSRTDDPVTTAYVADIQGVLALFSGDAEGAHRHLEQAVTVFRACGDLTAQVEVQTMLGLTLELRGAGFEAVECYEEILTITSSHGESVYRSFALWALAIAVWRQGDRSRSVLLLKDSLRLARLIDDPTGSATCLEALAWIAADEGDTERVGKLMGAAVVLGRNSGISSVLIPDLQIHHDESVGKVRPLAARRFDAALQQGQRMSFDAVVAYALGEPDFGKASDSGPTVLTKREHQIAELITQGLTNRAIANELVISQRTVHGHVEHILAKLGFTSRAQVAAWIVDNR